MSKNELIYTLRDYAIWADANIWNVPIMLPDVLRAAADMIEKQEMEIETYKACENILMQCDQFAWEE